MANAARVIILQDSGVIYRLETVGKPAHNQESQSGVAFNVRVIITKHSLLGI